MERLGHALHITHYTSRLAHHALRLLGILLVAGVMAGHAAEKYRVKPGDVLDVFVPQYEDYSKEYEVNSDGDLSLALVGRVHVAGLTTDEVEDSLERVLSEYLLRPQGIVVGIKEKKRRVRVLGQVARPGWCEVSEQANVQEAISQVGGLLEGAILTQVVIRRQVGLWQEERRVNLKAFVENHTPLPPLENGDEVFVPRMAVPGDIERPLENLSGEAPAVASPGVKAAVLGAVSEAGTYEVTPTTTLLDLLAEAGGWTEEADLTQIRISRRRTGNQVEIFDLASYLNNGGGTLPEIHEADSIIVLTRPKTEATPRTVKVLGEVADPGPREISANMNLQEVLEAAGGTTEEADKTRVSVRRKGDGEEQETVVDLEQYLQVGDLALLPPLRDGDVIFVHKQPPEQPEQKRQTITVLVVGHVANPGPQTIVLGTGLQEALSKAGGTREGADLAHLRLSRWFGHELDHRPVDLARYLLDGDSTLLPDLEDGDEVFVPRLQAAPPTARPQIAVLGAVTRPGTFETPADLSLVHALAQAGGPLDSANLEQVKIFQSPDDGGSIAFFNLWEFLQTGREEGMPQIGPGDTVMVGQNVVHVLGEVVEPGPHPIPLGATVAHALTAARGPSPNADLNRIQIRRPTPQGGRVILFDLEQYVQQVAAGGDEEALPRIHAGDVLTVPEKTVVERTVFVLGQVRTPGAYDFPTDASVLHALARAGGVSETGDPSQVRIIRRTPQGPDLQGFGLEAYLAGQGGTPPQLENGDVVLVERMPPRPTEDSVYVLGQVRSPGIYAIVSGETDVLHVLTKAGGPLDPNVDQVKIVRRDEGRETVLRFNLKRYLEGAGAEAPPRLQNGDVITLGGNTIYILGAVPRPGSLTVPEATSLLAAVVAAGGFLSEADLSRVRLLRQGPEGPQVQQFDLRKSYPEGSAPDLPTMQAGDTILVDFRKRPRPSTWDRVREIISGIATGAAAYELLRR